MRIIDSDCKDKPITSLTWLTVFGMVALKGFKRCKRWSLRDLDHELANPWDRSSNLQKLHDDIRNQCAGRLSSQFCGFDSSPQQSGTSRRRKDRNLFSFYMYLNVPLFFEAVSRSNTLFKIYSVSWSQLHHNPCPTETPCFGTNRKLQEIFEEGAVWGQGGRSFFGETRRGFRRWRGWWTERWSWRCASTRHPIQFGDPQ